ncbi:MAG: DUF5615 family PIN-like protein [Treponema sp.]|nr:DUF5615 family PIN-like protein [Treponema sp.]
MKLLLDANLSWRLTPILSEHFGECAHVNKTELLKPASDIEIWNYAAFNGYTIVTQDSDFLNFLETKRFPPKVILIRIGNMTRKIAEKILINAKIAILEFENSELGLLEIV